MQPIATGAIFNHNLNYRKISIENKFKGFDIKKNSFVFMSIISDEIQGWDRKRNANFAFYNNRHESVSQRFDIKIVKDHICIYDSGPDLMIGDVVKKFEENINLKLNKGFDLIKLSLQRD